MCVDIITAEETDWRQEPPDSPGEWLWIIQWSCGCVMRTGVAWVPKPDKAPDDMIELPCGLHLSWEGQKSYRRMQINEITAWRKINLPPQEWCEFH